MGSTAGRRAGSRRKALLLPLCQPVVDESAECGGPVAVSTLPAAAAGEAVRRSGATGGGGDGAGRVGARPFTDRRRGGGTGSILCFWREV